MLAHHFEGGQVFPKQSGSPGKPVVHKEALDAKSTKAILKNCKARGVSVSSALFAACNLAWAKTSSESPNLPTYVRSQYVHACIITQFDQHDVFRAQRTTQ